MASSDKLAPDNLSIVIPVHNRRELTRSCLAALQCQTSRAGQIIVIDDGSSDGTAEMIGAEFPDVTLLRGDGNLWWTGATNLGITEALRRGASYIMTLNDDTVPTAAFIENLLRSAALKPGALIGAHGVDAHTGEPVSGGECMNWITASPRNLLADPHNPRAGLVEVTHYPGRGLLIPAEVFSKIGVFDAAHFPHYAADYDFTHRARRRGYRIFCDYSAVLGIYPEASGDAQHRKHRNWANYYRHLFHIKGGGNLKVFFWYAVRNCPALLLPSCLFVGFARRIGGYPLGWFRDLCSAWRRHVQ